MNVRATSSSFPTLLGQQLAQLTSRQTALQTEAATGQRVTDPSDDPRAMRQVLDLQNQISNLQQYQTNIASMNDTLTASYTVAQSLQKVTDRAGELATGVDGTSTPDQLQADGAEVNQLLEQTLQLANTQSQGTYLYGGTQNQTPPYTATRDAAGNITAITYNGNTTVPQAEISSGSTVSVTAPGTNTSGAGPSGLFADSRTNTDVFNHLISLRDHMLSGTPADVAAVNQTDLPTLIKDGGAVTNYVSNVGSVQSRLDTATSYAKDRVTSLDGLVSNAANADLATTLVALNETQNAYSAALKTGGTILSTSLLDYLK